MKKTMFGLMALSLIFSLGSAEAEGAGGGVHAGDKPIGHFEGHGEVSNAQQGNTGAAGEAHAQEQHTTSTTTTTDKSTSSTSGNGVGEGGE